MTKKGKLNDGRKDEAQDLAEWSPVPLARLAVGEAAGAAALAKGGAPVAGQSDHLARGSVGGLLTTWHIAASVLPRTL